jgi:hypothetical protein
LLGWVAEGVAAKLAERAAHGNSSSSSSSTSSRSISVAGAAGVQECVFFLKQIGYMGWTKQQRIYSIKRSVESVSHMVLAVLAGAAAASSACMGGCDA